MGKEKILIIEDDKFFRDLISKKLDAGGFDVAKAVDGKEAFEYLRDNIPSLIILDLILPGMDGYEVLSVLKKNEKWSQIPVVVLSNLGQREEIDRAMSLGADEYMVKVNYVPDEIIERVQSVIRKKYL